MNQKDKYLLLSSAAEAMGASIELDEQTAEARVVTKHAALRSRMTFFERIESQDRGTFDQDLYLRANKLLIEALPALVLEP